MNYYANFNANNGTSWMKPMVYTNKARAIRETRLAAEGERFPGNKCTWWVETEDGDCVAVGGMTARGQRWRNRDL